MSNNNITYPFSAFTNNTFTSPKLFNTDDMSIVIRGITGETPTRIVVDSEAAQTVEIGLTTALPTWKRHLLDIYIANYFYTYKVTFSKSSFILNSSGTFRIPTIQELIQSSLQTSVVNKFFTTLVTTDEVIFLFKDNLTGLEETDLLDNAVKVYVDTEFANDENVPGPAGATGAVGATGAPGAVATRIIGNVVFKGSTNLVLTNAHQFYQIAPVTSFYTNTPSVWSNTTNGELVFSSETPKDVIIEWTVCASTTNSTTLYETILRNGSTDIVNSSTFFDFKAASYPSITTYQWILTGVTSGVFKLFIKASVSGRTLSIRNFSLTGTIL